MLLKNLVRSQIYKLDTQICKCLMKCPTYLKSVDKHEYYLYALRHLMPPISNVICEQKRYVRGVIRHFNGPKSSAEKHDQDSPEGPGVSSAEDTPCTNGGRTSSSTSQDSQRHIEDGKLNPKRIMKMLEHAGPDQSELNPDTQDVWSTSPYSKADLRRMQSRHAYRPEVDPKETSIILFPGQGSQFVGMGNNLLKYPNVRRMYTIASEILGYDLLKMCLHGSKYDLSKTIYCQPAIVVTSLAAVEKLKDDSPHIVESCVATAGFSVGELTALIFAGALSFQDGIKLVRIRAEAMQAASEMERGGMLTVFYGPDARIGFACHAAHEWCKKKGVESPACQIANYLFPGCKVIAGSEEAVEFITLNAKEFGIKRYKRLPVSGAFHTKLMLPAQEALQMAMESIDLNLPAIPVHSNVDGKKYNTVKQIRKQLPKQICSPVKWEQTLHILYERRPDTSFPKTIECGPGITLKTVLDKVNGKAYKECFNVET